MKRKMLFTVLMCGLILIITGCSGKPNTQDDIYSDNQSFALTRAILKESNGDLPKVEIEGTNFILQGKPFKFIGANAPDLVKFDEEEYIDNMPEFPMDVEGCIHNAKELGITVLRFYIDWKWVQPEEIDKILDIARREGMYVIPTFDFMEHRYESTLYTHLNDRKGIEQYKELVKKTLNRKNTINGKTYKEDTTILAWDIANEPNLSFYTREETRTWLEEISSYYKSIDPHHLITFGLVPCQFKDTGKEKLNLEYLSVFNVDDIDFLSFHFYPPTSEKNRDVLRIPSQEELEDNISFLGSGFLSFGKPVVLEEYGFSSLPHIDRKYRAEEPEVYLEILKRGFDAAFREGLAGVLFWEWGEPATEELLKEWNAMDITIEDKDFCKFIQEYDL